MKSIAIQKRDKAFRGNIYEEWNKSRIYVYDVLEQPLVPEGYLPNWQAAPVVPLYPPYNWDGYAFPPIQNAVPHIRNMEVVLSKISNPQPNYSNPDEVAAYEGIIDWAKDFVQEYDDPTEPYSEIQYPLVENANEDVNLLEDGTTTKENHKVVGVFSITFFWRRLITDVLAESSKGTLCL